MSKEDMENIFSPKGEKLSRKEIKEYMSIKKYLIRKIKKSPNFHKQLETGDLSEYYAILEELKLKDKNGNSIEDEKIFELLDEKNPEEEINR